MSDEYLSLKESQNCPIQRGVAKGPLLFLNFTKPDEHKDVNNQKIIRCNAMLHFRRQKRVTRDADPVVIRPRKCLHCQRKPAQTFRTSGRTCLDGHSGKVCPEDDALILDNSLHIETLDPPIGFPIVISKYGSKFVHHCELHHSCKKKI